MPKATEKSARAKVKAILVRWEMLELRRRLYESKRPGEGEYNIFSFHGKGSAQKYREIAASLALEHDQGGATLDLLLLLGLKVCL
jgi:hypothetical protein